MPSSKRLGEDADGAARQKKLAGSARTGQACDRCKVRKIRCDARPGGCSPCLQNNTECRTTDRITGRAMSRGHAENLENEVSALKMYVVELQQQVREHGGEPKQPPNLQQAYIPGSLWMQGDEQPGSWGDLNANGLMSSSRSERNGSQGSLLPVYRGGCTGDNYLGVSTGNELLSPIEGMRLTLFGMRINLADFLPSEDDPLTNTMSYHTFLTHAFRKTEPVEKPALPNHEMCRQLADFYFKSVQTFLPILHRPDFTRLISRIHHGHYQPTMQENVQVHMMLATMHFQMALRNGDAKARMDAVAHYHYSLSFVPDLIIGHTLEDIQALALICLHLRSLPRLGAAWMFTDMVLGLAVEMGLHRSANAWQGDAAEKNSHTIEMRKRIFWSLLVIHVSVSGKLGRPMPLRLEDFDIELPEHVSDNLPAESSASKWRKCSFRVAIPGMKLIKILMQVYATVYSIRTSAEPYEMSVRRLEKELTTFREQLPPELSGGPQTVEEDRCPALYLRLSQDEIRLILHHPALCRAISPDVVNKNLDVCLKASKDMLETAVGLKNIMSLDSTWYYTTDFLAAIFTTLFTWTQRQDQMDQADLDRLRADMGAWLEVINDVGVLLGSGTRLHDHVGNIIETSMANLSRHLAARTASAGLASSGSPLSPEEAEQPPQPPQHQHMYAQTNGYPNVAYTNSTHTAPDITPNASQQAFVQHPHQQHNAYPNHYYTESQPGALPQAYPGMGHFDINTYQTGEQVKTPNLDPAQNQQHQQLNTHHHQPTAVPMAAQQPPPSHQHTPQPMTTPQHQQHPQAPTPPTFMPAAFQHTPQAAQNGFHHPHHVPPSPATYAPATAWRNWSNDMEMMNFSAAPAHSLPPGTPVTPAPGQEYMGPATTLMSLGHAASPSAKHHPQQAQHPGGTPAGPGMEMVNLPAGASMGTLQMAPPPPPPPVSAGHHTPQQGQAQPSQQQAIVGAGGTGGMVGMGAWPMIQYHGHVHPVQHPSHPGGEG